MAFTLLFFKDQLRSLFKTDFKNAGYFYSYYFESPGHWINRNILPVSNTTLIENNSGIKYNLPKGSNDRISLKVILGKPFAEISENYNKLNQIKISDGVGLKKEFDLSNLHIGYNTLNLTDLLSGKTNFDIHLKALPPNKAQDDDLVIRGIELSVIPPQINFLPNLSLILIAIVIPIILFYCFQVIGLSVFASFLCSFVSLSVFYLLTNFCYGAMSRIHIFIIPAVSILYILIAKIKKVEARYIYTLLFIALLVIAVNLRWSEIERVTFSVSHPDVSNAVGIGYLDKAEKMKLFSPQDGFYAAKDMHEPFYSFVAKIFMNIIGLSDLHIRFVSFFFSILVVILTYLAGKELFKNRTIALMATGLIVINQYLIEQASFGLRMELEMCFLLALFYFSYLKRDVLKEWVWILLIGIIGGYWLLTKFFMFPVILFIFGYSAFRKKNTSLMKKIIIFILASLVAGVIYMPYMVNNYKRAEKLLAYETDYATYPANIEFAGRPGFPRDKVGITEYYFKLHTPSQLFSYHLIGALGVTYCLSQEIFNIIQEQNHLIKIFLADKARGLIRYPILTLKVIFLSLLVLSSILFCLFNQRFRLVVYIIYLANLPSLFLFGVNVIKRIGLLGVHRVIYHVLPFVAFIIAVTIYKILTVSIEQIKQNIRK